MTDQSTTKLQSLYKMFSSGVSFANMVEQFFPSADYGDSNVWVDLDNAKLRTILNLPRKLTLTYDNAVPITTNSMNIYATTSLWWLIICCSEYTHEHEIPRNTVIMLPSSADITTAFAQQAFAGLRGQIVTI